jgi:hypothetical protein
MSAGAKREEIIDHLFQSKSIASLKLWGRALARLQSERDGRLVWSLLSEQDFIKSGSTEMDLAGVIDELIANIPSAEIIALVYSRDNSPATAIIGSTKAHNLHLLFPGAQPVAATTSLVTWRADTSDLAQAEQTVLLLARSALV